ncbi:hypothetical protein P692DRAFT_201218595 [Suillus brevipes Sb2]|nr:hypothetical protein P692DRAFT_201218595 [Suillus brevipes Sb2]
MLVRGRNGKDRCPGRTLLQAAHGLPSPVPRNNLAQQLRPSHLCNPSQLSPIRLPHLLSVIMPQLQVRRPHALMYCSDGLDSGLVSGSLLGVYLLNTRMVVISPRFPRLYHDSSRALRILRLSLTRAVARSIDDHVYVITQSIRRERVSNDCTNVRSITSGVSSCFYFLYLLFDYRSLATFRT